MNQKLGVLFVSLALVSNRPDAMADELRKYRAVMADYFFRHHQAMPLFSNGEEAVYVGREACFDVGQPQLQEIDSVEIEIDKETSLSVGGAVSLKTVAEIEAELGAKLQDRHSISIGPLSLEAPSGGYKVLERPLPIAECDVVRSILALQEGGRQILVTAVFNGAANTRLTFDSSGVANASGKLDPKLVKMIEDKIKLDLGREASIHVDLEGSEVKVSYVKTPKSRALAVQSAFIDPGILESLYMRLQGSRFEQLRRMLFGYYQAPSSDDLAFAKEMDELLTEAQVKYTSTADLYSSLFSTKYGIALASDSGRSIPDLWWDTFAAVAAAHEIVAASPAP
jgi:hypothetical protein